jgi:hypothetical protein
LRDLQAMISNSLKAVIDTGADLAESGEYEESQEFGGILKELLKMDQRISMELARSEEFGRSLMMREGHEEASRDLEEFKALKDSEDNSIKWSENSLMKEYNEITWECGPGYGNRQGYPLIVNEDGGEEEEFSVQVRDSLICPISQGQMKEPVKNSTCNHSYSKEMIERLFIGGQQTISCPVSGCRGVVQKRNLERDENLERKISKIEMRIFNK